MKAGDTCRLFAYNALRSTRAASDRATGVRSSRSLKDLLIDAVKYSDLSPIDRETS